MNAAQLIRRLRPVELYVLDAVAAAAVVLLCLAAALAAPQDGTPSEPVWASMLTALAIGLPIAVRRRWPYQVAILVTVVSSIALGVEFIPSFAAPAPACALALAFYTFGTAARDGRAFVVEALSAFLVSLGLLWPALLSGPSTPAPDTPSTLMSMFFGGLIIAPSAILGFAIRERREQNAQRSEQLRREAAMEERLRLARDLHDIIAHTMTLIVVKASIGNHVAESDPAEARDALQVIEQTGRAAMLEVRKVLDVLREETPSPSTPGLDDLPHLVELASVGDAQVTLTVDRPDGSASAKISESMQLTVYRIVQEAVTNVVKHAAPARCHVTVVIGSEEVRVEVSDDGKRSVRDGGKWSPGDDGKRSPSDDEKRPVGDGGKWSPGDDGKRSPGVARPGHGLIGMRERVALHGGTFSAGPRDDGGFSVTALLPIGDRAAGGGL